MWWCEEQEESRKRFVYVYPGKGGVKKAVKRGNGAKRHTCAN